MASKVTGFSVVAVNGRTRGNMAHARTGYHCGGAGANGWMRSDAHPRGATMMPAGTPSFVFTRDFHYSGALYSRGCRVCLVHAEAMGLIAKEGAS